MGDGARRGRFKVHKMVFPLINNGVYCDYVSKHFVAMVIMLILKLKNI